MAVGMQQLSLFQEGLPSVSLGEACGREEKVHQAVTASERTEPMVSDLMEQVVFIGLLNQYLALGKAM